MTEQPDELKALAAEYALGTLDLRERGRAQDLLARDRAFARLVEEWERRLVPLAAAVPPVAPPAEVWRRIEHRVDPARRGTGPPVVAPAGRASLLESLSFWRWATASAGAAALAAAAYAFLPASPTARPGPDRLVAVLGAGEARPALMVTIDRARLQLTVRPLEPVGTERRLELWLLAGSALPQSLGLLDPGVATTLQLAPAIERAVDPSTILVVSQEPEGGSPTGRPTGPVVYQGPILPLDG